MSVFFRSLIWMSLSVGALPFSSLAKTLEFKPLSIQVQPEDKYLVRGFKGKITVVGRAKGDQLQVTLKQIQPAKIPSDMKDIVDEWLFSVQRKGSLIEVVVRSPHSKTSWEKTLQSQIMPSFEMELIGPSRELELALREGDVRLENWSAAAKIYAQNSDVLVQGGEGELDLGVQEGKVTLLKHKGKAVIESYSARITSRNGDGFLSIVNFTGPTDIVQHDGPVELKGYEGGFVISQGKGRLEFDVDRATVKVSDREGELRGKSQQGSIVAKPKGEAEIRLTTKEGNISLTLPGSGAQVNLGTEEGQIYAPNYLRLSRLPTMKMVQGRMKGSVSGQVYVRSQSGSIRVR